MTTSTATPPTLAAPNPFPADVAYRARRDRAFKDILAAGVDQLRTFYGTDEVGPIGLTDETLEQIGRVFLLGARPAIGRHADMLGNSGEIVSRQWDTIHRLREQLLTAGVEFGPRRPTSEGEVG